MSKSAVCSVVTSNFIIYLKVFCASILKHTPNFNKDYIVYYFENDFDESNFKELKKIYKNFIFKKINQKKYFALDKVLTNEKTIKRTNEIKKFAYARIEMFKEIKYDQIIYFDIDMVVIKDLSPLFRIKYDDGIMACEDYIVKRYNLVSEKVFERDHRVQGGVIIVGKKVINKKVYQNLLDKLSSHEKYRMNDQSLFTEYFGSRDILKKLDLGFNCGRKILRDKLIKKNQVFIIHYPGGKKPFNIKTKKNDYGCETFTEWQRIYAQIQNENFYLIKLKDLGIFKFSKILIFNFLNVLIKQLKFLFTLFKKS